MGAIYLYSKQSTFINTRLMSAGFDPSDVGELLAIELLFPDSLTIDEKSMLDDVMIDQGYDFISETAGDAISGTLPSSYIPSATESSAGKIEIATQSEINVGSDNIRAITPLGLSNWLNNVILHDDFFTSASIVQGDIGQSGWRFNRNGTGNTINAIGAVGHHGIIQMIPGSTATGRVCLYLGDTGVTNILLSNSGVQNQFTIEFIVRFTGSILSADLEINQIGLMTMADTNINGESTGDGVYVRFNPSSNANFVLVSRLSSNTSTSVSSTAVSLNTWYRLSIVFTDLGSGNASAQLQVNGSNSGSSLTTNLPVGVQLMPTIKIDGVGSGASLALELDRVRIIQSQQ